MPQIDFGTFQLFPDQLSYSAAQPSSPTVNDIAGEGIAWITLQAEIAAM
jgi:mannan endo-1,4-beta-mannosidase